MSLNEHSARERALAEVEAQLAAATDAKKCHACGCLRSTVEALSATEAARGELAPALAAARAVLLPKRYDCLGCEVCFPAVAENAFDDAFPGEVTGGATCPTDAPAERAGWPPLPGDFHVLRYAAPVAVCTLNSAELARQLASAAPAGVAIVGTLHTENLGIERLIRNVLANPHLRFLVLCGEDTRQAIGHLPGQSLASLFEHGVDANQRIVGAQGKRPVLKNVGRDEVEAFRRQVELVPAIGESALGPVLESIRACAARDPGAFEGAPRGNDVPAVMAREPQRLVPDPAGFFVVYPDTGRKRLMLEHYSTAGVLDCILQGAAPSAIAAEVVERGLISRLDHAAYLGRELARAEESLRTGAPYVQDRAPGAIEPEPETKTKTAIMTEPEPKASCGCGGHCSTEAP